LQRTYRYGGGGSSYDDFDDNDNHDSFSTDLPPAVHSIFRRGWPDSGMLEQCNLYGRALERLQSVRHKHDKTGPLLRP
jgi:hypothetical protein